ncbi:glycosyl hydrolase family 18 protein [Streptacidiphilus melanogenes]|uniref:glycosyl hydrolase family 18 protein n=1 Tax=Streptacidiphilus melanogenes TaxID=411235 RepID=UPI0007C63B09|nr:glycosyl hydrolase family 18 protein [Streptacidiphilus melanogenes]
MLWRGWIARRAAVPLLALAVALLPFGLVWAAGAGPEADVRSQGRDAVWLGHAWVDGRHTDADAASLLRSLGGAGAGHGVRDLYVHVGPTRDDGTLDPALAPRAAWVIATFHRLAPGVRVQAWLGDVVASEGPSGLVLSRATTRTNLLASASSLLALGFDGINLDVEPVHSGDRGYLALLDRLHTLTRAHGRVLSVAVPQTDPLPPIRVLAGALTGHPKWWSRDYLAAVSRRVDQVDVMAYDSGMPTPALFSGYLAEQTTLALAAVPPSVDVLIGLPAYRENSLGHHADAETVPAALHGIRAGLAASPLHGRPFGVALYADFSASTADWTAYRDGWG